MNNAFNISSHITICPKQRPGLTHDILNLNMLDAFFVVTRIMIVTQNEPQVTHRLSGFRSGSVSGISVPSVVCSH